MVLSASDLAARPGETQVRQRDTADKKSGRQTETSVGQVVVELVARGVENKKAEDCNESHGEKGGKASRCPHEQAREPS